MKKTTYLLILLIISLAWASCESEESGPSERFEFLTGSIWQSDSLLINGEDASGPGELLEDFVGTASFNEDGTGTFGNYEGTWRFALDETQLVITSDSLPVGSLSTNIMELTASSLKVTTAFPDLENPSNPVLQIRLTFQAQ